MNGLLSCVGIHSPIGRVLGHDTPWQDTYHYLISRVKIMKRRIKEKIYSLQATRMLEAMKASFGCNMDKKISLVYTTLQPIN